MKQLTAEQHTRLEDMLRVMGYTGRLCVRLSELEVQKLTTACRGIFRRHVALGNYLTTRFAHMMSRKVECDDSTDNTVEQYWSQAHRPRAPFGLDWSEVPFDHRVKQYMSEKLSEPTPEQPDLYTGAHDWRELRVLMLRRNPQRRPKPTAVDTVIREDARLTSMRLVNSRTVPEWMRADAKRRLANG